MVVLHDMILFSLSLSLSLSINVPLFDFFFTFVSVFLLYYFFIFVVGLPTYLSNQSLFLRQHNFEGFKEFPFLCVGALSSIITSHKEDRDGIFLCVQCNVCSTWVHQKYLHVCPGQVKICLGNQNIPTDATTRLLGRRSHSL